MLGGRLSSPISLTLDVDAVRLMPGLDGTFSMRLSSPLRVCVCDVDAVGDAPSPAGDKSMAVFRGARMQRVPITRCNERGLNVEQF